MGLAQDGAVDDALALAERALQDAPGATPSDQAGLSGVTDGRLDITLPFATFEEWWEPFTLGVGPAGDHVRSLDDAGRDRLAAACRARLPHPPFELTVSAWAARGITPG